MPNVHRKPTPEEAADVRARHAAGETLTAIAKATGIRKAVLSVWGQRDLGLDWDRTRTAAATQTRKTIAAAKRAQLELDYLDDAQRFRLLNLGRYQYQFTTGNIDADRPHPGDQLKLQQASISSLRASLMIADHESGAQVEQVKSLLGDIASALDVDTTPPADDEAPDVDA